MGQLQRFARRVRHLADGQHWGLVAGAGGLVVLIAVLLAVIVYLPPLAIDPRGLSRNDWLTHVESLRATILQGLGGLALLGTLYFSARTLRLNRRGQLTERFSKAIEQLGSETLAVRLGGIYAMEQIAVDSRELHWPVMEVLTAYLREHARVDASTEAGPTARKRLARGEVTPTALARELPFTRQAVSKHLVVLERSGLVAARRQGREVRYVVRPERLDTAARAMARVAVRWDQRLETIKRLAESAHREASARAETERR
jgi:DNA-binding transcriptional ArsR family regulator